MFKFYELKNKKEIQCNACFRKCTILPKQVGYCGVRLNTGSSLKFLNYGKFIFIKKEKGKLLVGGFGSNMRFSFDMDWDTSLFPFLKSRDLKRSEVNILIQSLGFSFTPDELIDYALKKECEKIIFQFNEPIINIEYLLEISKKGKIDIGIVSNGYFTEDFFNLVLPNLSEISILFYSTFDKFYFKHSRAQLSVIKKNIFVLNRVRINLKIIYLLIEGENDSEREVESFCNFVLSVSDSICVVFRKYIPSYRVVDKGVTSGEVLERSKEIALKIGLKNVILEK